jgi:hypothetical protein
MTDNRDASNDGSRAQTKRFSLSRVGSLTLLLIAASIPVLLFGGWIVYRAAEQGIADARVSAMAAVDRVAGLPPEKWSSLRYGFWPCGGLIDVEEAAQARRDCCEAAAG